MTNNIGYYCGLSKFKVLTAARNLAREQLLTH